MSKQIKKKIFVKKFALFAKDHFHGEKNGRKFGMKLNIAVINVEE